MSDLLFTGGTIITVDTHHPRAEALLCRDRRIVAVGDQASVAAAARPNRQVIDLAGRALLPGFNDGHIHALNFGIQELFIPLDGLSKGEIVDRLREHESTLGPGEFLFGSSWDYPSCPDPDIRDLDRAFPDRPVFLIQFSGHGGWVNTAALRRLRITPTRASWGMGGAEMDEEGRFTGILREPWAQPRVRWMQIKRLLDRHALREALVAAFARLPEHGITSVQDNTFFPWVINEIRAANRLGEQTARFSCWSMGEIGIADPWFGLKHFDPDWYSRGPAKFFWDGSFSARTAWLSQPYSDKPETRGAGTEAGRIERILRKAVRRRRQIAAHAIGDAAVAAYVEAFSRVRDLEGIRDLRFRIEHAQLIQADDIERIAELGMIVSAQPHAAAYPEKDLDLIGADRSSRAYPYRSLLDAGVPLAFGSDYPGESTYDPLYGIHLAVNMQSPQAISPEEAIAAYTLGSAYAEFRETEKGKLATGYLGDMVVLSADPTTIDPGSIKDILVEMTFVDGRRV
ncbi:MAG: amidohydrolase, partial [Spirochaetales bacterium]